MEINTEGVRKLTQNPWDGQDWMSISMNENGMIGCLSEIHAPHSNASTSPRPHSPLVLVAHLLRAIRVIHPSIRSSSNSSHTLTGLNSHGQNPPDIQIFGTQSDKTKNFSTMSGLTIFWREVGGWVRNPNGSPNSSFLSSELALPTGASLNWFVD